MPTKEKVIVVGREWTHLQRETHLGGGGGLRRGVMSDGSVETSEGSSPEIVPGSCGC